MARPEVGEELHDLVAELYPICRSITGDGVRETLAPPRRDRPARGPRGPDRHARSSTGRSRASGTSATRTSKDPDGPPGRRLPGEQPPRRRLQHAGRPREWTLAELRAHLFTIPERPDWIPYRTSYYRDDLGLLPEPRRRSSGSRTASTRSASTARSRTATSPTASCISPGEQRGRGADLDARLPSVALQRQPLGHRGRDVPGADAGRAAQAALVPLRLRPGHDRRDRLAAARTRRTVSADQARSRPDRRRRPRAGSRTSGAADAGTPRSTGRSSTCSATPATTTRCSTSRPTATTSASTARPASTFPSAASCARPGAVPRVPHVGRRPRPRHARTPGRLARQAARRAVRRRRQCDLRQPQPRCASRSSAGAACTARAGGRKDESARRARAALGAEPLRLAAHAARHRRALRPRVRRRPAAADALVEAGLLEEAA